LKSSFNEHVCIVIETSKFSRTTSGSLVGPIFLKFGEHYFPSAEWRDFPVVIIAWWLESVGRAIVEDHSIAIPEAELLFMDGDAVVQVRFESEGIVFRCVRDAVLQFSVLSDIEYIELLSLILCSAKQIMTECARRAWTNGAVQDLVTAIARAEAVVAHHKTSW
jgi:hypothetical protein